MLQHLVWGAENPRFGAGGSVAAQQQRFSLRFRGCGAVAGTPERDGIPCGCHWQLPRGPLALWQLGHAAESCVPGSALAPPSLSASAFPPCLCEAEILMSRESQVKLCGGYQTCSENGKSILFIPGISLRKPHLFHRALFHWSCYE